MLAVQPKPHFSSSKSVLDICYLLSGFFIVFKFSLEEAGRNSVRSYVVKIIF